MQRGRWFPLSAVLVVLLMLAASADFAGAGPRPERDDGERGRGVLENDILSDDEDCLEPTPQHHSIAGVTDDGRKAHVKVLVLADAISRRRADRIMRKVAKMYVPLGVRITWRKRKVRFQEVHPYGLFREMREEIDNNGERPPGVHIVHLITGRPIEEAAGMAYCIGGIKSPLHAFSWAEDWGADSDGGESFLGLTGLIEASAIITAHELGHLLGAHHHYANCAEGLDADGTARREWSGCTVMTAFLTPPVKGRFSTLSGAVIRGYALAYGSPARK